MQRIFWLFSQWWHGIKKMIEVPTQSIKAEAVLQRARYLGLH